MFMQSMFRGSLCFIKQAGNQLDYGRVILQKRARNNRSFAKELRTIISRIKFPLFACMVLALIVCAILWQKTSLKSIEPMSHFGSVSEKAKRLPQAIIIGCRKSGTRALLKFLEVHPAVQAARREVHFFDRPVNYQQGLDWYRNQMPETRSGELSIEKSPAYFVVKNVPERVSAMNSSIRLIVIFRNPVTRLISDFSQLVANRFKTIDDDENRENDDYYKDEEADSLSLLPARTVKSNGTLSDESIWLEAEKELERYILRPDGGIDDQRRAVRIGMYSMYLEKWLSIFPRQQMHFVDGERLISEPSLELQKLELFLGLEPYIKREHFVFEQKKGFYCLNGTLSSIRGCEKESSGSTRLEPHCLSRSKGRRHVKLRGQLMDKLGDFYEPYNEYLYALTGINFNKK